MNETLPDPLPRDPLPIAAGWLQEARIDAAQPNPNAMVLATVDARGQPSARVVLCKEIDTHAGCILFYTNYESRKGRELAANPRAAIVFHWDHRHRQVRAEGVVETLSAAQSDDYFQGRAWQSRLGAWASRQSEPIESRRAMIEAVESAAERFAIPRSNLGARDAGAAVDIPRPSHWGGFRLRVEAMELWVEGDYRIHDRARWTRGTPASAAPPVWAATRLQP